MSAPSRSRLFKAFEALSTLQGDALEHALETLNASDPTLAENVRELLASDLEAETWFGDMSAQLAQRRHAELDAAWAPGREIGPYRLERLLASGGMGAVFLARKSDGELKRPVALKLIPSESLPEDSMARLRHERDVLASLSHPHIAHLLDAGLDAETAQPWIAMEFVDGPRLDDWCASRDRTLDDCLDAFLELAQAVAFTHRHLIVHGDIKPGNVLVGPDRRVMLLDFGIAHLLRSPRQAGAQASYYSPNYSAPEIRRGERPSVTSDVYSLGCILSDLSEKRSNAPPELASIVKRACHADPESRYQSVTQLIDEVERMRCGEPVRSHSSSAGYRLRRWLGRHRTLAAFVSLILTLVLSFAWISQHQAELHRQERDKALALSDFLESVFASADPEQARGEQLTAIELLDRGTEHMAGLPADPPVRARFLTIMARSYQRLGQYPRAIELFGEVAELEADMNQPLSRARSLIALAETHHLNGEPDSAKQFFEQALSALPEADSAELRVLRAEALAKLGRVQLASGQADEGQALLAEAVEGIEGLAESHPEQYSERLNDLASGHWRAARHDEALALITRALEIRRRLDDDRGASSPRTATLISNAGLMHYLRGRSEDAERLFLEALDIRRAILPAHHPEIAQTLTNYGLMLKDHGRSGEAVERLEGALRIRENGLRPGHVAVAEARLNLATALQADGQLRRAQPLFEQAVAELEVALGPEHPSVAVAHSDFGALWLALGEPERAEYEYRRAQTIRDAVLAPDHPHQAWSLLGLGRTLVELGRGEEARPLLERALRIRRAILPGDHPLLTEVEAALAGLEAEDDPSLGQPH